MNDNTYLMTNPQTQRLASVSAVLFDAYGTLVEITDKRAPFRQLLRLGERQGRRSSPADALALMTAPVGLRDAADLFNIRLTADEAVQLETDLQAEIVSVRLFPDTLATLQGLRERGFTLGLCSNLAANYAEPVMTLLHSQLDAYTWSFEAGAIKPDPFIYEQACQRLGCAPAEVLMVGDTLAADVDGPRACGMQSIHLDRAQRSLSNNTLASLSDLMTILDVPGTGRHINV